MEDIPYRIGILKMLSITQILLSSELIYQISPSLIVNMEVCDPEDEVGHESELVSSSYEVGWQEELSIWLTKNIGLIRY